MPADRLTAAELAEIRARSALDAGRPSATSYRDRARLLAEVDARGAELEEARAWVRRLTATERVLTCAFCGEAYPPGTPDTNHVRLTAHVYVCAKHPLREMLAAVVDEVRHGGASVNGALGRAMRLLGMPRPDGRPWSPSSEGVDDAPYVCPGCHAVAPERCAAGCIDAEMAEEARHAREDADDDAPEENDDASH